MITQIRLQNFMSHSDTVLDLADGLTVLIGPNNCGKSAVVEALRAVCENATANYMIRHGEKEARVTVTTSEGHTVVWIRTKASAAYEIDGVRYDRLQGKAPDELHRVLCMPLVPVESGGEEDVHIADQKDPIFLLKAPGSRPAAFFASSSDAGRLIQMQELHRSRKRDREREKRALDAGISDLDSTLDALKPLRDVRRQATQAADACADIAQRQGDVQSLAGVIDRLSQAEDSESDRSRRASPLSELRAPPGLQDSPSLGKLIIDIHQATGICMTGSMRVRLLSLIQEPPAIYDVDSLEARAEELQTAEHRARICLMLSSALSPMSSPPALFDTAVLRERLRSLSLAQQRRATCERTDRALSSLVTPPVPEDTASLQSQITSIEAAAAAVDLNHRQVEGLQGLTEPPATADLFDIRLLLEHLSDAFAVETAYGLKASALDKLAPTPMLGSTSALEDDLSALEQASTSVAEGQAALKRVSVDLQTALSEIDRWVRENPSCPTCGADLSTDTLLEVHRHV